jgi:peptidoglycan/LPS O-acetylase OafA/YrhL
MKIFKSNGIDPSLSVVDGRAHIAYLEQRHFGALDGLRCISILLVLWHHCTGPWKIGLLNAGFLGVDLFFVISGFLIVTLILREKHKTGSVRIFGFYRRRAVRILPPYYALLGIIALIYFIFKRDDVDAATYFGLLPFYVFFLSNWTVLQARSLEIFWSLAAEQQFYLLWPIVEKWFSGKFLWCVLAAAIFANQLMNFDILRSTVLNTLSLPVNSHLPILEATFTPILLGVALAHVMNNPKSFAWLRKLLKGQSVPFVCIFAIVSVAAFSAPLLGYHRLIIHISMAALVGSLTMREDTAFHGALGNPIVVFIGRISYGMYVYHMIALHIGKIILGKLGILSQFPLLAIATLITILIAFISFEVLEKPFLALGKNRPILKGKGVGALEG